jgi:hypothetical protein
MVTPSVWGGLGVVMDFFACSACFVTDQENILPESVARGYGLGFVLMCGLGGGG